MYTQQREQKSGRNTPRYLFHCPQKELFLFVSNCLDCVLIGNKPGNWTTISIERCIRAYDGGTTYMHLDQTSGYETIYSPSHNDPNGAAYLLSTDNKKLRLEKLNPSKELYNEIGIPTDYLKQINLSDIPDTKQQVEDELNFNASQLKLKERQCGKNKIADAKDSLNAAQKIFANLEQPPELKEKIKEAIQLLEQLNVTSGMQEKKDNWKQADQTYNELFLFTPASPKETHSEKGEEVAKLTHKNA